MRTGTERIREISDENATVGSGYYVLFYGIVLRIKIIDRCLYISTLRRLSIKIIEGN